MHDLVVRDLEQARNRTLGLTDLDDPPLVTQHDLLMSPLVWDLAHVGQQEELRLLRAGGPARPGPGCSRQRWTRSTTRSSTPAPSARRCRCCRRLRRGPTTTRRRFGVEEEVPALSPCSTSATSRPRPTPAGPGPAARRDRVGEGVRVGPRSPAPAGPGRGDRRRPDQTWSTWAACGAAGACRGVPG